MRQPIRQPHRATTSYDRWTSSKAVIAYPARPNGRHGHRGLEQGYFQRDPTGTRTRDLRRDRPGERGTGQRRATPFDAKRRTATGIAATRPAWLRQPVPHRVPATWRQPGVSPPWPRSAPWRHRRRTSQARSCRRRCSARSPRCQAIGSFPDSDFDQERVAPAAAGARSQRADAARLGRRPWVSPTQIRRGSGDAASAPP